MLHVKYVEIQEIAIDDSTFVIYPRNTSKNQYKIKQSMTRANPKEI